MSSMALQSIFHFFIENSELAHQHRNDIYSIEKTDTILPFASVRDRISLFSPFVGEQVSVHGCVRKFVRSFLWVTS